MLTAFVPGITKATARLSRIRSTWSRAYQLIWNNAAPIHLRQQPISPFGAIGVCTNGKAKTEQQGENQVNLRCRGGTAIETSGWKMISEVPPLRQPLAEANKQIKELQRQLMNRPAQPASAPSEAELRKRVAALQAENAKLRQQLADDVPKRQLAELRTQNYLLRHDLAEAKSPAPRARSSPPCSSSSRRPALAIATCMWK